MAWSTLPPGAGWTACEGVLRRFEQAWKLGPRPDLAGHVADGPHRLRLLVELVHIDLECRLRAGEYARVEEYLERFPELDRDEVLLDLIANEFAMRQRWQDPPWPDEYFLRFPRQLSELPTRLRVNVTGPTRWMETTSKPDLPGFEILGELGRGGMGVVWQARQVALDRIVALKTLRPGGAATAEERDRFRREAEALARLDHPHVAPILDVGEHTGTAYLVMKFYPGGSLAREISGPGADPRRAAHVVETIAHGVHHAHQRGILHRDLKPANVLLDADGQPHVADFGLARLLDSGSAATAGPIGTPSYMAPEQARDPSTVTVAADVWGLGAILYELLAGRPPFRAPTAMATLEKVVHAEPVAPRVYNRDAPADLETIALRCLDKDPQRRYPSAAALADDLARWRAGEPINARPAGRVELALRWGRRHPLVAALAVLTVLAVVSSVVILAVANDRLARKEAETARTLASEQATLDRERRLNYLERVALAGRLWASNQTDRAATLLDQAPEALRGWEWDYLDSLRRGRPAPLEVAARWVSSLAASGKLLAVGGLDGSLTLWDLETSRPRRSWKAHVSQVTGLAFAPDGTWFASADANRVRAWDTETGALRAEYAGVLRVAISPDGQQVASAGGGGVVVHDTSSRKRLRTLKGHSGLVLALAFRPDGKELASSAVDRTVRRWDPATGREVGAPWTRPLPVTGLSYALKGRTLVEAEIRHLRLTDAATGTHNGQVSNLPTGRFAFAISPDGRLLAVADRNQVLRVRDLSSATELASYRGEGAVVTGLAFVGAERGARPFLASGDADGKVRLWDAGQDEVRILAHTGDWVGGLAFHPGGRLLAVAHRAMPAGAEQPFVRLVDVEGLAVRKLPGSGDVAFHPAGVLLAAGRFPDSVVLWNAESGEEVRTVKLSGAGCVRLRFTSDGRRLVIGTSDGTIHVADVATGKIERSWRGHRSEIDGLACHPTEPLCATVARTGRVTVWDLNRGVAAHELEAAAGTAVAFSPDGTRLLVGHADRAVRLWNWREGVESQTFLGHALPVADIAFHKDGRRIATAGSDGSVRIWDVASGLEVLTLPGVSAAAMRLAWSRDGARLAAVDSALRLWEVGRR